MNKAKRRARKRRRDKYIERINRRFFVGVRHRRTALYQEETEYLIAETPKETKGKQKKASPGYFINEYGYEQPISTLDTPRRRRAPPRPGTQERPES